jgi:hypothetical protein
MIIRGSILYIGEFKEEKNYTNRVGATVEDCLSNSRTKSKGIDEDGGTTYETTYYIFNIKVKFDEEADGNTTYDFGSLRISDTNSAITKTGRQYYIFYNELKDSYSIYGSDDDPYFIAKSEYYYYKTSFYIGLPVVIILVIITILARKQKVNLTKYNR